MSKIEIEYNNTLSDMVEFNLYHYKYSPAMKKTMRSIKLGSTLLVVIAMAFLSYRTGDNFAYLIMLPLGIVFSVIIFFIWPIPRIFENNIKKQTLRFYKEGANKHYIGKHTLTLAAEGITETTEYGEQKTKWSGVEKVALSDKHIYIYIASVQAFVIPVDSFPDQKARQDFVDTLYQYMQAAAS